jgi:hypothetical protein
MNKQNKRLFLKEGQQNSLTAIEDAFNGKRAF